MMANYEIIEFIAIMHRLIDNFTFILKASVQTLLAPPQKKKTKKNQQQRNKKENLRD